MLSRVKAVKNNKSVTIEHPSFVDTNFRFSYVNRPKLSNEQLFIELIMSGKKQDTRQSTSLNSLKKY